ncbi:hypothetical protein WICMUC_005624 [Wickerhamomyces mucosus]|uniref:PPM-type phosphatase domain-containing protein n=1 Tax=Wickerhamomyces mucosus TaxID=1378264 RepID=A0A9P8P7B8_9ASCO|nr:hypothetical protein WICMUC_005624 [Wickerhamomyces mucosus]
MKLIRTQSYLITPKRTISDFVSFPIQNYNPQTKNLISHTNNNSEKYLNAPRLKIPLLRAPSHLGHCSYRMQRLYNEDRYAANVIELPMKLDDYGLDKWIQHKCFTASVFDGHGGDSSSNFLQEELNKEIESTIPSKEGLDRTLKTFKDDIGGYWKRIFKKKNDIYDELKPNEEDIDDLRLRLYQSYLNLDYKILKQESSRSKDSGNLLKGSGSTSTSVFLYNLNIRDNVNLYFNNSTISRLYISQVGDSKAIICARDGIAHSLNSIHHPTSLVESKRLNKYSAGFATDSFGENRFLNYANTRAFGDLIGKSKGISAEPDITSYIVGDSNLIFKHNLINETVAKKGGDECFLVLVSDGISNFATDQEIVDLVMTTYNHKYDRTSPQECAEEVVKYVEAIGGDDNASCLVIRLNNWGHWPENDRTGQLREDKLKDSISKMERR